VARRNVLRYHGVGRDTVINPRKDVTLSSSPLGTTPCGVVACRGSSGAHPPPFSHSERPARPLPTSPSLLKSWRPVIHCGILRFLRY
jgi:hypothetical protein